MLKNTVMVVMLALVAAGCGGVKAQTYVMTTKRVDITNKDGNAGYISGQAQYQEPVRKTRKVYVLELTKPVPESEVKKVEQEVSNVPQGSVSKVQEAAPEQPQAIQEPKRIVIPRIDDDAPEPAAEVSVKPTEAGPSEAQSYTVLKDDTLQKIAKKFYGSYGKWIKIYEANKEKIKNPNVVKPGIVIVIPAVGDKK